ncbi:unnamed protein product [Phytophthora lilii]|uniref:Unnamed protein product n=1 Tax=Phytophthora lilii TaxID=2077276 RepID=A0A9W6YIZ6_9STRA|nr:unnamed protein product [Phytophthora lilii]
MSAPSSTAMVSNTSSKAQGARRSKIYSSVSIKDEVLRELWRTTVREQWKREQQRRRMVRWRLNKKERVAEMLLERQELEKVLQTRVQEARVASDKKAPQTMDEALRLVTIESAALMRENLILQEAIDHHVKLENSLQLDAQKLMTQQCPPDAAKMKTGASAAAAKWTPQIEDDGGWCVVFQDGAPSFHFHPFSREQVDQIRTRHEKILMKSSTHA